MSTRSPHYYMEPLIIEVESILFCIPKYVLALPGTSFESMLLLPQSESTSEAGSTGQKAEGKDDVNPIKLDQSITALQFTYFLSIVYPFPNTPAPTTIAHWMGVYDLASMWSFEKARMQARDVLDRRMSSMSGAGCIELGKKYNVSPWVKGGLIKLIRDDESLDIQLLYEGGLGAWTICTILSIRENFLLASKRPVLTPASAIGSTATKTLHQRNKLVTHKSTPDLQVEEMRAKLRDLGDEEALAVVQRRLASQFDSLSGNGKDEFKLPSISRVQSVLIF